MTTTHRAADPVRAVGTRSATARRVGTAAAVVVLLLVAGGLVWHLRSAATPSVPYSDPAAVGRLTLCSADGQPVTHGSIAARPFAASVVSDTEATGGYADTGRTATLLAAQPRAGVDPAEWSTLPLTPGDTYPEPAHPALAPSATGTTLGQFLNAYPALDGGWVQLRLVLGGPGLPAQTQQYAVADLHISGDSWTVADPGSASCPTNH